MVNPRLQPTEIGLGTTSGNSTALRLGYGYGTTSNNGNIQSQDIVINTSTTISPSYTYNQVNRLLTATEGATWSQNYSYDQDGNRAVTG